MPGQWTRVATPVDSALRSVTAASDDTYTVGDDGRVCRRRARRTWHVVNDGSAVNDGATLRTVDATNDGQRIWIGGDAGTLVAYDANGPFVRTTRPVGVEGDVRTLAVTGTAGDERVYAATDDGTVYVGGPAEPWQTHDVADAPIVGVAAPSDRVCVAVTPRTVCRTRDAGASWTTTQPRHNIEFTSIAPGSGRLWAGGRDGRIHRYDRQCDVWTSTKVAAHPLSATSTAGPGPFAVGDAGTVASRGDYAWRSRRAPTPGALHDVTVASRVIAVGDSGTVVERPRDVPVLGVIRS